MQVTVEKISNVERRLTIVVPANEVEEAYTKQIDQFVKTYKFKGFRPGKVPRTFVEKQLGGEARKEALSNVIQKNLVEAITEQKLKPINNPTVEPKSIGLDKQPLEFTASFEILPEIEKVQFSMDKIEKLNVEITPKDLDFVVEQLRKQYTKWNKIDREVKAHDRVVIDYYAIFEGKSDQENKVKNFPLELGSNIMLPGFEDGLIGAKAGEQRTLHIKFPDDFNVKEKAGKPVDFVVDITSAFEAEKPEVDEKFVQQLGIKSGEQSELKEQIKTTLEGERNRLVQENLKEQVFKQLLELNQIDVPTTLINREAKNLHDEVYQNQEHNHASHSEEEMKGFNETAKKRVALGILISEYAKLKHITADKNRVLDRIKEIAAVYENPKEVVQWLSTEDRLAGIEAQVLEDQILDHLMQGIPVTEKNMTYAELKGIR